MGLEAPIAPDIIRPEMVLVDAGMRGSSRKVEKYLKEWGKIYPIKYILLPMLTSTHVGGAGGNEKNDRAKLVIHQAETGVLSGQNKGETR